jgi:hypothetical protein
MIRGFLGKGENLDRTGEILLILRILHHHPTTKGFPVFQCKEPSRVKDTQSRISSVNGGGVMVTYSIEKQVLDTGKELEHLGKGGKGINNGITGNESHC